MTIIYRVREICEERGITIKGLAYKAGLSRRAVHDIYHNNNVRVELATLESLAKALGVTIDDLFKQKDGE